MNGAGAWDWGPVGGDQGLLVFQPLCPIAIFVTVYEGFQRRVDSRP